MPDLHPVLTAFPLAFIALASALECWQALSRSRSFAPMIRVLLIAAALATAAAFYSGYEASEHANQTFNVSDDHIALHHLLGRWLLFLIFPCALLSVFKDQARAQIKRGISGAYYVLLIIVCALVFYTGRLGGELVFEHGAGVRATGVKPSMP